MNELEKKCFASEVNKMTKMLKSKMDEEAARFWEAHNFRDHHRETRKTVIAFVKRPKGAITLGFK